MKKIEPVSRVHSLAVVGLCVLILIQLACLLPELNLFEDSTETPPASTAGPTNTPRPGSSPAAVASPTSRALATALKPPATQKPAATLPVQPLTRLEADKNALAQLFPEAAKAGAPQWFTGSVRITYTVASATTTRDPNGKNTSGSGLVQYDLAAVDGQLVAGNTRFFLDTDLAGTYHPSTILESWGTLGTGEYWVNPQALANAEGLASDVLKVVRGPATVSGKTYQAVRFEYQGDKSLWIWMIDTESGLLIYHRQQIGTETDLNQTNSILSLVGVRSLKIPWVGTRAPASLQAGTTIQFAGTQTLQMPNMPAQSIRVTLGARVSQVGTNWTQFEVTDSVSLGLPGKRVTGTNQLCDALWLPAEAFAAGVSGKTLDSDPYTGAQVTASARNGLLYLTETGKAFTNTAGYDEKTGLLVYFRQEIVSPLTTTILQLQKQ